MKKINVLFILVAALTMGCSSTLLQCGIDGDSSYVTFNATKEMITEGGRNIREICSFAKKGGGNAT